MATTREPSLSPRGQAMHDHVMSRLESQIESWTDEKTLESIIETQQRIARYEREHRMSSATMRQKIMDGEIDETREMVSWSFDLDELDHLLAEYP